MEDTNLVILACKNNRVGDLESILVSEKKFIQNWRPGDNDCESHNAFYYAIRSNNTTLLQTLIEKWPDQYFVNKSEELDELLSKAFKELKLKNINLSDDMELFVTEKLINFRFFNDDPKQFKIETSFENLMERIELVVENINFLNKEFDESEMDERFLLAARCVAQNLHVLKRQLRYTYRKLPWEEIEFCLIVFIRTRVLQEEINSYNFVLTKKKILKHLLNFSNVLDEEKKNFTPCTLKKLAELPKLTYEKVVANIVKDNPFFEELYGHYTHLRDFYSLDTIKNCIKLALLVDCKEREGQLIITRSLQVIGEHLKNTLESPNLSPNVSGFLLSSLPQNSRRIVMDLRNSLSHSDSLCKRMEVEENAGVDFFINVQNDIKKINIAVTEAFHKYKMKVIRNLLTEITVNEDFEELKEMLHSVSFVKLEAMVEEHLTLKEQIKLEELIKKFDCKIDSKTTYEKDLFKQIYHIIKSNKDFFKNIENHYNIGLMSLKKMKSLITDCKLDEYDKIEIKEGAIKSLNLLISENRSKAYESIAGLLRLVSDSAMSRLKEEIIHDLQKISWEIFIILEIEIHNVKSIEILRDLLADREQIKSPLQKMHIDCNKEVYKRQLMFKISILKSVLDKCELKKQSLKNNQTSTGKKPLALIEILLLDILSILSTSNNSLTNNLLSLDNDLSVLIGRSLRNHLAHGNALTSVLLANASIATYLNAKSLISEEALIEEKKIGKIIKNNIGLKEKYNLDLSLIILQREMFNAAKLGDKDRLANCIIKGSDINSRSITSSSILHFAAESRDLSVVEFAYERSVDVSLKNIKGETPLHIAAMHGRPEHVKFFLLKNFDINEIDNQGKTALHIAAANNHKSVVELLLKKKANITTKDTLGYSPVHYAVLYNYMEISKLLLHQEDSVDINQVVGGFTSLHLAAEHGHTELCSYLLRMKANANAKNDIKATPLHVAALNGHLEIVKELVHCGADVNSATLTGCTALHSASKNNHQEIIDVLVKNGAEVNVFIKANNLTPLFFATMCGNIVAVKTLLKHGAVVNTTSTNCNTPLHAAVAIGNIDLVRLLLKEGAPVDSRGTSGLAPLHLGAKMNYAKIVKFLIDEGATVEVQEDNGLTPLHLAAKNGHTDIIDILIAKGACINSVDNNGITPLHLCCLREHHTAVKLLIQKKVRIATQCKLQNTALHYAAMVGSVKIMKILLSEGADIHACNTLKCTPLHMAIGGRKKEAVKYLIEKKSNVNVRCLENLTLLHMAVQSNDKAICEILIENDAEVDAVDDSGNTPLCHAVRCNFKEIVSILLRNKADVNVNSGQPLCLAIGIGNKDMVQLLLQFKGINVNIYDKDISPLFMAATLGHHFIAEALIAKGANTKVKNIERCTVLHTAAEMGHVEMVKLMLDNNADLNARAVDRITPLHCAAHKGHADVAKILLKRGATFNVRDSLNRTPLEIAVSYNHLEVVKVFILEANVDINASGVGQDNWTLLHIASQSGALEIVKYLTGNGANINKKNALGLRPVHIAARNGFVDVLKFFVSIDQLSGNHLGQFKCTPLHYAAIGGHLNVAQFLVAECNVEINVSNIQGMVPLHVAVQYGHEAFTKFLLNHGAKYNAVNIMMLRPFNFSKNSKITLWLNLIENLFQAVKQNNYLNVEKCIKEGAFINVKNVDDVSPLHHASWKGLSNIVDFLLDNGADPNIIGKGGCTPLHYASKFGKLKIVQQLLLKGARYNALSQNGKTPLDFSSNPDVTKLLKFIDVSFKSVLNGDCNIIKVLNENNFASVAATLNACNRSGQTLLVVAIRNDFPLVQKLKDMFQPDVTSKINLAIIQGHYQEAEHIYKELLKKRSQLFGNDSPATLDIQKEIALMLCKQNMFKEALNTLEDTYQRYIKVLGTNNESSLNLQSLIALTLHDHGKYNEAILMFEEVYEKQKKILGPTHQDVLVTLSHMALSLDQIGRYEEALKANQTVYDFYKSTLGLHHPRTLIVQNNIAMILNNQGEYEESLEMYQEVYKARKETLGSNNCDTLRTLHNIARVYASQKRYNEALKTFRKVYDKQEKILGLKHLDVLHTKCNIANVLLMQGKFFDALNIYKESLSLGRDILDDKHPTILDILQKIKLINFRFKLEGEEFANFFSFNA